MARLPVSGLKFGSTPKHKGLGRGASSKKGGGLHVENFLQAAESTAEFDNCTAQGFGPSATPGVAPGTPPKGNWRLGLLLC